MEQQATFFATESDFRAWLETNHKTAPELLVGFWKKGTGRPSIDWPQARDQALCFGWIDGVRKSMGDESFTIRFTPRRKGSVWSTINVDRVAALKASGQMTPAGEAVYEEGNHKRSTYAYESDLSELTADELALFRANPAAWTDWEKRPPGYRKVILHWITSAKKPETRAKRLATLIEDSEAGRKVGAYDIARPKDGR
jgi:uncharacterized protein YdeI (YjbR/CyaY-like superfamily)